MSWALRFVVTQGEYESQRVPILHIGYLTKLAESAQRLMYKKHDGVRCRCEMTIVLKTCRNKNTICSRILFAPQCGKQCLSWQNAYNRWKFSTHGWTQDSEFQVIRKTVDQSNNKNGIGVPKSHSHVNNGQKSKLESWGVYTGKFRRHSDIFSS